MLRICYHGTEEANVESILKNGFNPNSWFAKSLQDALAFGGPWVFEVMFEDPPDIWQFHCPFRIESDHIVNCSHLEVTEKFENKELRHRIFESNLNGGTEDA